MVVNIAAILMKKKPLLKDFNWRKFIVILSVFTVITILPIVVYLYLSKTTQSVAVTITDDFITLDLIDQENSFGYTLSSGQISISKLSDGEVCVGSTECSSGACSTFYVDSDGDGYGDPSVSVKVCGSNAPSGYTTNNTDCYDSNANARPGQTTCYSSHRGDGSYDYDCNGSNNTCSSCYSFSGGSSRPCSGACNGTYVYGSRTLRGCGASGNTSTSTTCYNQIGCTSQRPGSYYKKGSSCTMTCK